VDDSREVRGRPVPRPAPTAKAIAQVRWEKLDVL